MKNKMNEKLEKFVEETTAQLDIYNYVISELKKRIRSLEQNVEELITKQGIREGTIKQPVEESFSEKIKKAWPYEGSIMQLGARELIKDLIGADTKMVDDNSDKIELNIEEPYSDVWAQDGEELIYTVVKKEKSKAVKTRIEKALEFYDKYKDHTKITSIDLQGKEFKSILIDETVKSNKKHILIIRNADITLNKELIDLMTAKDAALTINGELVRLDLRNSVITTVADVVNNDEDKKEGIDYIKPEEIK